MNTNRKKIEENGFAMNDVLNKKGAESIQILNEIDFLITNASTVPLTSKVVVDAEYLFSLTERFRKVFPAELEQAEMVINEIQDIVEVAEAKAEMVMSQAHSQAQAILNESRILKEAQARASIIINDAKMAKEQMQNEAESYVCNLFAEAEHKLMDNALAVKQAVSAIKQGQ